ncbi:MAG: hypothetical protein GWO81_04130 [Verrucomicrobia bacterium]|nr:hypothetical protein [Verrucomicrobiota bacterium]
MQKFILIFLAVYGLLTQTACNQYGKIPEGAEVQLATPAGPAYKGPTVVHADMIERVATIRYGHELGEGFLIVRDPNGEQTSLLKSLPLYPGRLRTADILEGNPKINNRVEAATQEQNEAYKKIYPDAQVEN